MRVYRIQDSEGRGPFRPGFTRQWSDEGWAAGMIPLPTFGDEFGWDLIDREGRPGEWFGSAVRSLDALNAWFSASEQQRLAELGFRSVAIIVDRVLAESKHQLVFARRKPLRFGVRSQPWPWIVRAA